MAQRNEVTLEGHRVYTKQGQEGSGKGQANHTPLRRGETAL
jgi:hypothetical protein